MLSSRTILVALCLLVGAGTIGFAGGANEPSKALSEAPKALDLRISWWCGSSRHEKWNALLDKFQQKYPHITVKREFTDYNGYWDKLATQAAGGNAPDVIMQVMHKFAEYAVRGQMMELDGLIASRKIDLSDWGQAIIDSGKLNGKTFMVSYGNTTNATMYNATMFEQIGVKPAPMSWTWQVRSIVMNHQAASSTEVVPTVSRPWFERMQALWSPRAWAMRLPSSRSSTTPV